ncbi:10610_t:CDS:2 [Rhizophagus irregularis]|nr:10610_t:CDS:2 [Rhizophagus irregularis]
MFLDTIWNNRSTEPVWFRLIRGFFAITLTGIIIYYAIVQYQKIGTEASIAVKFERINGYKLNMSICTGISNGINNVKFSVFSEYDYGVLTDPYCNPYTIPNNLLSLNFESFQYLFSSKSDLDYSNYNIIDTSHFSLYLGRAYFIHHKPTMVDYNGVELNLQLEQLPIQLESNEVRLRISPDILLSKPANARFVRFESTRIFGFTDLISNLGGFYGAIAGLFYLFFGMQRLEPWKYVSSAGIPLVEKVDKRPEGSSLEQRVQILETLLRDYYLDDYYLKKVKYVRVNHKRFLKKYEEINRQDNEDTENTESTELDASLV